MIFVTLPLSFVSYPLLLFILSSYLKLFLQPFGDDLKTCWMSIGQAEIMALLITNLPGINNKKQLYIQGGLLLKYLVVIAAQPQSILF